MTNPSPTHSIRSCVCGKESCTIPFGTCHCGCGEVTGLVASKQARTCQNWRVGLPKRYIHNHHRRLHPLPYFVEDRGYLTPCWIWQRYRNLKGYGIKGKGKGKRGTVAAHIWYWQEKNGQAVPLGKELDHLCRQRPCCNPDHLEPVTDAVNSQRGSTAAVTSEQVLFIRARLSKGERQSEIAKEFGVTRSCIYCIAKRKSWRNL